MRVFFWGNWPSREEIRESSLFKATRENSSRRNEPSTFRLGKQSWGTSGGLTRALWKADPSDDHWFPEINGPGRSAHNVRPGPLKHPTLYPQDDSASLRWIEGRGFEMGTSRRLCTFFGASVKGS
jgi:hypothetical protein